VKLLRSLSLLPIFLVPALCQTARVELSGQPGRAEVKVAGVVLHADEATLNHETGELILRGHVHVTLPAREDHTVVRYGAGVLLTDQPIGLTADRVTVKNGLLEASGNIVVVPADPELPKVQLRGDELAMHLQIADATLRGNVRPSGIPEVDSFPRPFPQRYMFPPDIVK
jgi:lipopolysaccharide assembly outer membrane protein LptD (OstA)